MSLDQVRVLVPVGMLGGGFPAATLERGLELGADVIAVDGGSTDSGPHYLGTATAKSARGAVARDVGLLISAAARWRVPVVIGSCGTSGTDDGVEWIYDIAAACAAEQHRDLAVTCLYSELFASELERSSGRIHPLPPAEPLPPGTLGRCSHIVGLMGHEPIAAAVADGAELVLAGRATDTALIAAVPLLHGMPPGPTWHAAKIAECGGLCTTNPLAGGVLVTIDHGGFSVEPLSPDAACTPTSVAAHMMYENADPFRMREPAGWLDTSDAVYTALDDRVVRVEGSRFEPVSPLTIKLEGAARSGSQTLIIVGIREPATLARLDEWCALVLDYVHAKVAEATTLTRSDYDVQFHRYGHDAVLGEAEPYLDQPPREVGLVFMATAPTQSEATQLAKLANPALLHAPLPGSSVLPSHAFLTSPAEIERGDVYEFVLQHAIDVDAPSELFRSLTRHLDGRS